MQNYGIKDSLNVFLETKEAISSYQHGLMEDRPCLTTLLMKVLVSMSFIWTLGRHSIVSHINDFCKS